MTTLRIEPLVMPGVTLGAENPLPQFRERNPHRHVAVHESLPVHKQHLLGHECGVRVLPYRMQDNYSRQREMTTYQAIVLENDILKATFMPALGGRLWSLLHKPTNRELLNRNPVFQPANLAVRNAWFSGGIEWNVSQYGHTFATCSPIFAGQIAGTQGEPGVRLYEYERCKNICWQIDFYLPNGSAWLIAHTRIVNPNSQPTSMYWWTNTAVNEALNVRVLAPTDHVIYTDLTADESQFGYGAMPHLGTFKGQDASYSLNAHAASEYFFQPDEADMPWEAALDANGSGFIEASTPMLRYRKMFCWGTHQGGRHWQEFLAPGGHDYLEIQAGLAPSQLHGLEMPAHADWQWTQVFGYFESAAAQVHHPDWHTAWQHVDGQLKARLSPTQLADLDAAYTHLANQNVSVILHTGSGWGALEVARRFAQGAPALPASWSFPEKTLGTEQFKWHALLYNGQFPTQDPQHLPGEWMVQPEWHDLLALHPHTSSNWYALLYLGVMRMEHFDMAGAEQAWRRSIALMPSAWAWRNLAVIARLNGDTAAVRNCMTQAWTLNPHILELDQEYLALLCQEHEYDQAYAVYDALDAHTKSNDRIQILYARIALERNDLATVERLMQHEYAVVREGETELTDIWFGMWYRRAGGAIDDTAKAEIRRLHPPPAHIDFRSINK